MKLAHEHVTQATLQLLTESHPLAQVNTYADNSRCTVEVTVEDADGHATVHMAVDNAGPRWYAGSTPPHEYTGSPFDTVIDGTFALACSRWTHRVQVVDIDDLAEAILRKFRHSEQAKAGSLLTAIKVVRDWQALVVGP